MRIDEAVTRAKAILADKLTADGVAFVERECLESLLAGYEGAIRKGRWTTLTQICDGYGIMRYFHKECKGPNRSELFRSPHPYCPNCGEYMRGPEPGGEE